MKNLNSFKPKSPRPVHTSAVALDPSSLTPRTLMSSKNLMEDPRLSKRGYDDNLNDVLPPVSFDPAAISRYSRYVDAQLRDLSQKHFKVKETTKETPKETLKETPKETPKENETK